MKCPYHEDCEITHCDTEWEKLHAEGLGWRRRFELAVSLLKRPHPLHGNLRLAWNPEQPGPDLDALIAEKWMGWHSESRQLSASAERTAAWVTRRGELTHFIADWHPSTNPAHAGEARRKAYAGELHDVAGSSVRTGYIVVTISTSMPPFPVVGTFSWDCCYEETNGDNGKAEALATCRAIVAALKAAEAAKEEAK